MNMNFLNKKTLLGIIIIGFLIIVGGIGAIFYWQKANISLDVSPEAVREKCFTEVDKIGNEELVNKVNNSAFLNEEELTETQRNTLSYLNCNLNNERIEFSKHIWYELFQRTANLIRQLNISEQTKESTLSVDKLAQMVYEHKDGGQLRPIVEEDRFVNFVALTPLEEICLNNDEAADFLETCLKAGRLFPENIVKLSAEEIKEAQTQCNLLCEKFFQYLENPDIFENYLNNINWFNDPELLKVQYVGMTALSFRIGGKELALKVCNTIPVLSSAMKEDCENYATALEYVNCKDFGFDPIKICQIKKYSECDGYLHQVKDSICESEVRKYNQ